jgi:hypothetical protein
MRPATNGSARRSHERFSRVLPKDLYARYYLSIRKLMADMPQTASRYTARMPAHTKQFNSIDFSDEKLLYSGLYTSCSILIMSPWKVYEQPVRGPECQY